MTPLSFLSLLWGGWSLGAHRRDLNICKIVCWVWGPVETRTTLRSRSPVPQGKPGWRLQDDVSLGVSQEGRCTSPNLASRALTVCRQHQLVHANHDLDPTHCADEETEALHWKRGSEASCGSVHVMICVFMRHCL